MTELDEHLIELMAKLDHEEYDLYQEAEGIAETLRKTHPKLFAMFAFKAVVSVIVKRLDERRRRHGRTRRELARADRQARRLDPAFIDEEIRVRQNNRVIEFLHLTVGQFRTRVEAHRQTVKFQMRDLQSEEAILKLVEERATSDDTMLEEVISEEECFKIIGTSYPVPKILNK